MRIRRIRPMRAAEVGLLPQPCSTCAFWEGSLIAGLNGGLSRTVKQDWARTVEEQWGACGLIAVDGEQIIGYLTLSPAAYVPRLGAFATTPISQDAVVVMNVRVMDERTGHGVGRQLIQGAAAMAAKRDVRALEAVASHRPTSCMMPVGFLQAVGFTVTREHPLTPRLRMDLQNTVRWQPDLGAAWQRLRGLVSRPPPAEPAGFEPIRLRSGELREGLLAVNGGTNGS